jgi:hypothetical protein
MNNKNELKEAYRKIYLHIKEDFPKLRKRLRDINWQGCSNEPHAADITILSAGSIPSPDLASEYDMLLVFNEIRAGNLECYFNDLVNGTLAGHIARTFSCGDDLGISFQTCVDEISKKPQPYWFYTLAHISKQELLWYT